MSKIALLNQKSIEIKQYVSVLLIREKIENGSQIPDYYINEKGSIVTQDPNLKLEYISALKGCMFFAKFLDIIESQNGVNTDE